MGFLNFSTSHIRASMAQWRSMSLGNSPSVAASVENFSTLQYRLFMMLSQKSTKGSPAPKAYTGCLFLDSKGAFDNVIQVGIIRSLCKKECPGYLVNLITGFLFQRIATLKINDKLQMCDIHKGSPL